MLQQFELKMKDLPLETAKHIHLVHGEMSDFQMEQKFPLILLPARSFQLLLDETKENACLKTVFNHLEENGRFIIAIANFSLDIESWGSKEEIFDWENTDPATGYNVRRTHIRKKIDLEKQVIYPQKIYRISNKDGTRQKIVRQASWKYFTEIQIKQLLTANGFKILEEMGSFDGKPIDEGPEFIFVCQKLENSQESTT